MAPPIYKQQNRSLQKSPGGAAGGVSPLSENISKRAPALTLAQKFAEARSLTARARRHFGGSSKSGAKLGIDAHMPDFELWGSHFSSSKNIAMANAAISTCHSAITAWLRVLPWLKPDSREIFEAYLSLGELYSKRETLVSWHSMRFFSDKPSLQHNLRCLEALQQSLSYIEKAVLCKEQPALPALEAQPLNDRLVLAHEYLSQIYFVLFEAYLQQGSKAEKCRKLLAKHQRIIISTKNGTYKLLKPAVKPGPLAEGIINLA